MKKGIYLALITACISGFSIFSNKIFVSQADPLAFTTVRNVIVVLLLTGVLFLSGRYKSLRSLKKRDVVKLIFIGSVGGGLAFALFFSGLAKIGAVQGNLIHKTLFLWVTVLAVPLLGERLHKIQLLGYACIMLAMFVIGGPTIFSFNSGSLLVLMATILWAVENVVAKVTLRNVPSEVVGWARTLLGIPVLIGITLLMGKGALLSSSKTLLIMPLLTSSLFLTGYVYTFYKGLTAIPVTLASSILVIAPVITNLLTAVFITHQLPQPQSTSAIFLALGAALILVKVIKPRFLVKST